MPGTIKRRKVESLKAFESQFEKKKNSNGGRKVYATRLGGKNVGNSLTVRFVAGPEQWVAYDIYWDTSLNRPVIATEENEQAYKDRNIRASTIHIAPAIRKDNGELIVVELKWSITEQLKDLIERKGPLTDYDVELFKTGSGQDGTKYFASKEEKYEMDLSRYEIPAPYDNWQDYLFNLVEEWFDLKDDEDAVDDDTSDDDPDEDKSEDKATAKKSIKLKARG